MKKGLKFSVVATTLLMGVSSNLSLAADTYDISLGGGKVVYSKNGGANQDINFDFDKEELTEQSNNTVNIYLGPISFDWGIFGGGDYGTDTKVSGNTVTLNSGTVGRIIGGAARTGEVSDNKVIIKGGTNSGVRGGNSESGAVSGNSVTITGGTINNFVLGGDSYSGTVSGNSVTITGGTINTDVVGGNSYSGTVSGNSVTITDGTINYNVYGGKSINNTATDNTVTYTGGSIGGVIYGGFSQNISKDTLTGNTLNIGTSDKPVIGLSAENIHNFQTINFYLPSSVSNGDTALSLTTTENTGLADTKVNAYLSNANGLTKDSVIHLISTAGTLVDFDEAKGKANLSNVSIAGLINITGKIAVDSTGKNLDLTFNGDPSGGGSGGGTGGGSGSGGGSTGGATANANSKQLLENSLAGMIAVNESIDNLVSNLDNLGSNTNSNSSTNANSQANINENSGEAVVFANIIGHDKRYITGSHVDSKGFSLSSGIVGNDYYNSGKLTTGLFVEYGKAKYESVLDNGLVGEGKTEFIGGGAFGKFKFINNFYTEASARIGNIKTKAEKGMYDEYKLSNTYYGAHFGLGKVFDLTSSNELDIYAKYFYSHIAGEEIELRGVNVDLGSVTSSKFKAGFKDTMKFSDTSSLYAGLAYQYEAKGDAKGDLSAFNQSANIASPSLKGSTGIGEIGYTYETNSIKFDIGAKGFVGKERGYSGNLGVTFKF